MLTEEKLYVSYVASPSRSTATDAVSAATDADRVAICEVSDSVTISLVSISCIDFTMGGMN